MCVPLKSKDRCIGVLNLSGRRDGGDFTDEDLKILTILASHAASAIDIAQLYRKVSSQVEHLEALYQRMWQRHASGLPPTHLAAGEAGGVPAHRPFDAAA